MAYRPSVNDPFTKHPKADRGKYFVPFFTSPTIISGFFGSAVVPTASVGVPPTESFVRNRPTCWLSRQAHRLTIPAALTGLAPDAWLPVRPIAPTVGVVA